MSCDVVIDIGIYAGYAMAGLGATRIIVNFSLYFRLRHKDTLCCVRIEIASSIASCVLSFRHFARLFIHFQAGDQSNYAASIQARLSHQILRTICFGTVRRQYSGVESCAVR